MPAGLGRAAYEFSSGDSCWQISLTRDFLALTCTDYKRWEQFSEQLKPALDALITEYKPGFVSRVGLRYKDVIRRSILGLDGVPWSELLKPHIAGELVDPKVAPCIRHVAKEMLLEPSKGKIRVLHGFVDTEGEESYLIDGDFFVDTRTEIDDVWNKLPSSRTLPLVYRRQAP